MAVVELVDFVAMTEDGHVPPQQIDKDRLSRCEHCLDHVVGAGVVVGTLSDVKHDPFFARLEQRSGMADRLLEPAELVLELGAGPRIAVRQVKPADQHAIDCRFDVPALAVVRIVRQGAAGLDRRAGSAQDRNAGPASLATPDRLIASSLDRSFRKLRMGAFSF